jgi:hypothetical protein
MDDAAPLLINPGVLTPGTGCRFFVGHEPDNDDCNASQAAEFGDLPAFVDDIRVYDRALSAADVSALYAEGDWPSCCAD